MSSPVEFYAEFNDHKARVLALVNGGSLASVRADALAQLRALQDRTKAMAPTLPAHDRQAYAQELDALFALLDSKAALKAKKPERFKFSKKSLAAAKTQQEASAQERSDLDAKRAADATEQSTAAVQNANKYDITDVHGQLVQTAAPGTTNLFVTNVRDSVLLLTPETDYATAKIHGCTNCLILVDAVTGPIYLTGLTGCVVVAACHQFRIHTSTNTDLFLSVGSGQPIIEHCSGLRFAQFPGFPTDKAKTRERWTAVDDFNWLDTHTPSPNWAPLLEAEDYAADLAAQLESLLGLAKPTETRAPIPALSLPGSPLRL